ncbi:MAG: hypothetical protein A2X81_13330 [Desulfobacterales bacterium GWB2_56_26]|nr:MAG: hypothetical protein A2X81_13330 [Desulfobacterales bacterium GWB2_56_26]
MPAPDMLAPDHLRDLLLQFKYQAAVRRLARGITHSYNNLFTGLGGQLAIARQDFSASAAPTCKRGELIDNLLQRGIEQTALLYDFSRDTDTDSHNHSPLLVATKALELLNSISRVHRFVLKSEIGQEKIVCNLRDLVLSLFYLGENCVDATPEGGDIDLTLARQREDGQPSDRIVFSFHDHGPGFTEGVLSGLFAPFVTTRSGAQHGLGLYAAETLARKNLGRLVIGRSGPGHTEVSAVFPATEGEVASGKAGTNSGRRQQGDGLGKQCILIVEDDEALRTLLLYRLQRRGHMVFCVDSCAEALEEYEHLHDIITIILMDVGLRDTSGYTCLREMLKIEPQARIIFMSGHEEAAPPELAGYAFLVKPFTLDQLEQAIGSPCITREP